jgi:phosphoglycerol transferase MdoB-like AlkP superfamily enzyme
MVNALYILLLILPVPVSRFPRWEKVLNAVLIISNSLAFLFETSDWAYYPYNFKRSTADIFFMISRKGDFLILLPGFIRDYWYATVGWILLTILLIILNKKIIRRTPLQYILKSSSRFAILYTIQVVIIIGVTLLAMRGGTQLVPIGIRDGLNVTEHRYLPVVLNTPFSIITTVGGDRLEEVNYFTDEELQKYIKPIKQYPANGFKNKNVVVIILESFSKENTKLGRGDSYTPFLDSLMDISLNCTNAYANGLHSAEGLPAIISGIPLLMNEPITTSPYGTNKITSLPNVLKSKGYSSAFYHGGTNGTMSFDVYCVNAGYDKYYGRTQYNNEADYDGNWGIWDEPFLQYFAKGLNKMKQPFLGTVFTLSSHPPYHLPEKYKNIRKGKVPIQTVMGYTDIALRNFFATVSKEPWFNNTLFVITADHASLIYEKEDHYSYNMGIYSIPILYYMPGDSSIKGNFDSITQQIDIMPSVLNHLGYDKPFYALGSSIFSNDLRYTVSEINNRQMFLMKDYLLISYGIKPIELYKYPADTNYKHNLVDHMPEQVKEHVDYLKAITQAYRHGMVRNEMWVDPDKK